MYTCTYIYPTWLTCCILASICTCFGAMDWQIQDFFNGGRGAQGGGVGNKRRHASVDQGVGGEFDYHWAYSLGFDVTCEKATKR